MSRRQRDQRAGGRAPARLWSCRSCRDLWTAVEASFHTRPQAPWKTLRVSLSSLENPAPMPTTRVSHSTTASTTTTTTSNLTTDERRAFSSLKVDTVNPESHTASLRSDSCPPSIGIAVQIRRIAQLRHSPQSPSPCLAESQDTSAAAPQRGHSNTNNGPAAATPPPSPSRLMPRCQPELPITLPAR